MQITHCTIVGLVNNRNAQGCKLFKIYLNLRLEKNPPAKKSRPLVTEKNLRAEGKTIS